MSAPKLNGRSPKRTDARRLNPFETEAALELHKQDPELYSFKHLALIYGTTPYQVQAALFPDEIKARNDAQNTKYKRRREEARAGRRRAVEASEREIRRRILSLIDNDRRDLTGRHFGDPPPGRSALDEKRKRGDEPHDPLLPKLFGDRFGKLHVRPGNIMRKRASRHNDRGLSP